MSFWKRQRKWSWAVLLGCFFLLTVWVQVKEVRQSEKRFSSGSRDWTGKKLDLHFKTLEGKTVELKEYRGKWVIVAFWASWCSPCRQELPELDQFVARWNKRTDGKPKIAFLAVNSTEETAKVKRYWDSVEMLEAKVLTGEPEQIDAMRIEVFPAVFLLNVEGVVKEQRFGYEFSLLDDFEKVLIEKKKELK